MFLEDLFTIVKNENGQDWTFDNFSFIISKDNGEHQLPHIDLIHPLWQHALMVSKFAKSTKYFTPGIDITTPELMKDQLGKMASYARSKGCGEEPDDAALEHSYRCHDEQRVCKRAGARIRKSCLLVSTKEILSEDEYTRDEAR